MSALVKSLEEMFAFLLSLDQDQMTPAQKEQFATLALKIDRLLFRDGLSDGIPQISDVERESKGTTLSQFITALNLPVDWCPPTCDGPLPSSYALDEEPPPTPEGVHLVGAFPGSRWWQLMERLLERAKVVAERSATNRDAETLEVMVGDDESQAIMKIARSSESANLRMKKICDVDTTYEGRNAVQWGKLLGCSAANIRQTEEWKRLQEVRRKSRRPDLVVHVSANRMRSASGQALLQGTLLWLPPMP